MLWQEMPTTLGRISFESDNVAMDRRLITENDQWAIYSTSATRSMQKDLDSFTSNGVRIGDCYMVHLGERKDTQDDYYLIFDRRTGKAVHCFRDYTEIAVQKIILEALLRDENDIVEMAKRRVKE